MTVSIGSNYIDLPNNVAATAPTASANTRIQFTNDHTLAFTATLGGTTKSLGLGTDHALTFPGARVLTLPESMTVAGRNVANTFTARQTIETNDHSGLVISRTGGSDPSIQFKNGANLTYLYSSSTDGAIGMNYLALFGDQGNPTGVNGIATLWFDGTDIKFRNDTGTIYKLDKTAA